CDALVYCCADHPSLHSFPTRRSSDLQIATRQTAIQVLSDEVPAQRASTEVDAALADVPAVAVTTRSIGAVNEMDANRFASAIPRSEEHTSELQSRENLVCRLLLEKKK